MMADPSKLQEMEKEELITLIQGYQGEFEEVQLRAELDAEMIENLQYAIDEITENLSESLEELSKHAETQERINEKLSGEIERRTEVEEELQVALEEAEDAREAADHANATKSSFLANMSHELRTPLNAIIGYSEMLQEDAEDDGNEDYIPDLKKIHSSGKHLLSLINDILDLSKIESGKMELFIEDFDLPGMVQDVAATVQPLIEKNSNVLKVTNSESIKSMVADETRVRQVLFNLLSNASKFTENGKIGLNVSKNSENGRDWITFGVSDTGIGMTEDQMGRLFSAFMQADASTTKKFGGTGLGLVISRKFCQMMGGELSVESEYGEGTTFTARIPLEVRVGNGKHEGVPKEDVVEEEKEEPVKADDTQEMCQVPNTVLVIDDDPTVHDLMKRFLTKDGYNVVSALDGKEGIKLAKEIRPVAITLDVMMPRMDGWAVLKELKADPEVADIPVIMQTMVDDKTMGYALGATDYVNKPIDRQNLAAILNKYKCIEPPCPILIVDDDPTVREMTSKMLIKEGWEVVEAENGKVGLEMVAANRPIMILLDLMMPVMNGFEFVRELRDNQDWRSIPVIIVSAKDLTKDEREELEGNVRSIVQKGAFSKDEFISEMRGLLKSCSV